MQMLNEIITDINKSMNETLFSKSKRFTGSKLFGICEQAIRSGTANQEYPAVFDQNGEGVYAGIDDTHNLIIYHRRGSVVISDSTVNKGFGDNVAPQINTYSMVMIAFFNRKKLQLDPDELAIYLQKHLPYSVANKNFAYLSISFDSVILNAPQVFRTEYANVQYFLKPEHSLISVSYSIEGKPNMGCFNRCPD